MLRRILIGIAGGSGSGKTLVARNLVRELGSDRVVIGRSVDSVIRQYEESVRPMHLRFVEPSKRYADVIIPGGGHNAVAIDLVKTKIQELLRERGGTGSPAGSAGRAPEPGRAPGGNAAWGSSESPAPGSEPCLADPGESS